MGRGRRVVGYARISKETEASTSVERQREIIRKTCEARGWDLLGIEEDSYFSASKRRLDRPGLDRVRDLVRRGEADGVLVWRLDRIARSVVDFGLLLDEGVDVISATEPLDTGTPMGRAMAEVLQVFAALESRTMGERIRASRAHLVTRAGRFPGGSPPYGYRVVEHPDGAGKALAIDAEEAAHVRAAADVVLGGGSLWEATRLLNERGSKPKRASAWSYQALRAVLTGDAVLGRVKHGGRLVRDEEGLPVAPWEPVLPLQDVERLRAALEPSRSGPGSQRRRRGSRLLSGLVLCDGCRAPMRVNTSGGSGESTRYVCRTNNGGGACPNPTTIRAAYLEEYVEREFLAFAGLLPVLQEVPVVREAAELAEVEAALQDLSRAITRPGADVATLATQISGLQQRREDLQALPSTPTVETVATGLTIREAWAAGDVPARRVLLTSALDGPLVVGPGSRRRGSIDPERVFIPWALQGSVEQDYGSGSSSR